MGKRKSTKGQTFSSGKTKLDAVLNEATEALRRLNRLEKNRKLTFDGFMKAALEIADCEESRIDGIEHILDTRHGVDLVLAFARRLAREFSAPQYVRPFSDPSKAVRIYGDENLEGQLGQHGLRAGEIQALAVRVCKRLFGEEAFGVVKNFARHEAEVTKLRARLDVLYGRVKDAVGADDLENSDDDLTPAERGRGLTRFVFRRAPGVIFGIAGWPRLLVQDCEAAVPKAEPISIAPGRGNGGVPRRRLEPAAVAV